jgi:hypothetical protein
VNSPTNPYRMHKVIQRSHRPGHPKVPVGVFRTLAVVLRRFLLSSRFRRFVGLSRLGPPIPKIFQFLFLFVSQNLTLRKKETGMCSPQYDRHRLAIRALAELAGLSSSDEAVNCHRTRFQPNTRCMGLSTLTMEIVLREDVANKTCRVCEQWRAFNSKIQLNTLWITSIKVSSSLLEITDARHHSHTHKSGVGHFSDWMTFCLGCLDGVEFGDDAPEVEVSCWSQ